MRRCVPFMILVVFACMFCISCSLEDFQIDSLVAVPYLIMDSNQMGLSLFIDTSLVEEKVPMQFHVSSPDGLLSWDLDARVLSWEGASYAGSSDICMPCQIPLQTGSWNLSVTLPDGRVFDEQFSIQYEIGDYPEGQSPYYGQMYSSIFNENQQISWLVNLVN